MKPYGIFDFHCDTLTFCGSQDSTQDSINDPRQVIALSTLPKQVHWAQCFAIFIPDELTGNGADHFYDQYQHSLYRQLAKFSELALPCRTSADIERAWAADKTAAILTVENGSALGGDPRRVEKLARDGVKMMTLTWNGENELASGNVTDHGLSPIGRQVIPLMEEFGILVDVSHLNDTGFYELLDIAKKPFAASHSDARSICGHPRNLTDDQIREMVTRKCLIGLNFCDYFLRDGGSSQPEDLMRHIEHFLTLGAEDCLALGSDFDGTDLPPWLDSTGKLVDLYSHMIEHGFSGTLCDKIFFQNASEFFRRNLP